MELVISMLLQNFVVQLVFGVAVTVGIYLVITPGAGADPVRTIAIIGLISQFVKPLQVIAEFGTTLRTTENELADIAEILDMEPLQEPDAADAAAVPDDPAELDIAVEDVHFQYRDDLPEVLSGASFTLPAGSLTALIGSSGSGKTTVTRLIARFWDVTRGAIKIAGHDIRDYTTADLMSMLSLVFQDIYLFDDTLEANIAYGNPAASPAEIRAAADSGAKCSLDGWDGASVKVACCRVGNANASPLPAHSQGPHCAVRRPPRLAGRQHGKKPFRTPLNYPKPLCWSSRASFHRATPTILWAARLSKNPPGLMQQDGRYADYSATTTARSWFLATN